MSYENARQYVYALVEDIYKQKISGNLPPILKIPNNNGVWEIDIEKEIRNVCENGQADVLQYIYDSDDQFLSPILEIGQDGEGITKSFSMESRFGSCVKTLKTNGMIGAPEKSLADDICYFREMFVDACNSQNYKMYSRAYRAYLLSSISLIECFLQRYIFHIREQNVIIKDEKVYNELKSTKPIDERIKAWLYLFTDKTELDLINTKEWSQFMEIKKQRNHFVHPTDPMICYEIRYMIPILNNAIYGIGGLLILLRKSEKKKEYIGFIRKIYNQSKIEIV